MHAHADHFHANILTCVSAQKDSWLATLKAPLFPFQINIERERSYTSFPMCIWMQYVQTPLTHLSEWPGKFPRVQKMEKMISQLSIFKILMKWKYCLNQHVRRRETSFSLNRLKKKTQGDQRGLALPMLTLLLGVMFGKRLCKPSDKRS